ncbi:putative serine/threonine phosphatase [Labilithrix luteola]|uniref:Putative serine/threonine phosphatase n=1 Tax=Labilithrix luteola TaxID=1391654 RepID=A0A0K1Q4U3_9BACT|nr:metallophosphoesterase [Labilithrix luteola]AKV00743.1 putative serine/threonine phosphatase [Labilithrix luteola]
MTYRTSFVHLVASLGLTLLLTACSSHERVPYAVVSAPRDWSAHPAVLERDAPAVVYAMSDVHGGYDRMVALLVAHHVIATSPPSPEAAQWTAGDSVLVVTGDLMDKGPSPLEAIDLLRTLESQAATAGGQVVFTLGNHEAEFLYDPENDKATKDNGVDHEIRDHGLTPVGIANGSDPRGAWLRDRSFGARVGDWFFAHAGNTKGRSVAELEQAFRAGILNQDYADPEIIGGDSILESRGWYGGDPQTAARYANAVGARHIVFGHQPDALGPRGEIAVGFGGVLFRIDCGMSPDVDDSHGRMLRIRRDGNVEIAESLDPDGGAKEIWRQ